MTHVLRSKRKLYVLAHITVDEVLTQIYNPFPEVLVCCYEPKHTY